MTENAMQRPEAEGSSGRFAAPLGVRLRGSEKRKGADVETAGAGRFGRMAGRDGGGAATAAVQSFVRPTSTKDALLKPKDDSARQAAAKIGAKAATGNVGGAVKEAVGSRTTRKAALIWLAGSALASFMVFLLVVSLFSSAVSSVVSSQQNAQNSAVKAAQGSGLDAKTVSVIHQEAGNAGVPWYLLAAAYKNGDGSGLRGGAASLQNSAGGVMIANANAIIQYASTWLGIPYSWGGGSVTGPTTGVCGPAGCQALTTKGFDCSSFTQNVYYHFGVSLPRTADAQQAALTPVSRDKAVAGDLVFWGTPAHHVGLYLGNNQVMHAPKTGDVIKVSNVWGNPVFGHYAKWDSSASAFQGGSGASASFSVAPDSGNAGEGDAQAAPMLLQALPAAPGDPTSPTATPSVSGSGPALEGGSATSNTCALTAKARPKGMSDKDWEKAQTDVRSCIRLLAQSMSKYASTDGLPLIGAGAIVDRKGDVTWVPGSDQAREEIRRKYVARLKNIPTKNMDEEHAGQVYDAAVLLATGKPMMSGDCANGTGALLNGNADTAPSSSASAAPMMVQVGALPAAPAPSPSPSAGGGGPNSPITIVNTDGERFTVKPDQLRFVALFAKIVNESAKIPAELKQKALLVTTITAIVESRLRNLPGGDRDSAGLFQQRPSTGWGTIAQVTDPVYATNKFLGLNPPGEPANHAPGLMEKKGWETKPPGDAAQYVQVSGLPLEYGKWLEGGATLIKAASGVQIALGDTAGGCMMPGTGVVADNGGAGWDPGNATYQAGFTAAGSPMGQGCSADPLSFCWGECVSWAGWYVKNTSHSSFTNNWTYNGKSAHFGNGGEWAAAARDVGIPVDKTPTVGSVGMWHGTSGRDAWPNGKSRYGHVGAIVKVYPDGSYDVSQYNVKSRHTYSREHRPAGWFQEFIHFEKAPPQSGETAPAKTAAASASLSR